MTVEGDRTEPVRPAAPDVEHRVQVVEPRDRVRWGPIWAGLLTAMATFLLLSTLAIAIGAQAVDVEAPDTAERAGVTSAIVTAIIALLSFLIGGLVAARASAVTGRGAGALNGFMVWALGTALILLLAVVGLGALFGALGDLIAQLQAVSPAPAEGVDVEVDTEQLVENIRNSALGTFLTLALPALAATIGGWLGARVAQVEYTETY